jgi:type IV secretory pathway TrbL component
MDNLMSKVIGIAVALLLVAVLVPVALTTLAGANVTGVDDTVVTVLTILLPILAIIGIAMYFIPRWK